MGNADTIGWYDANASSYAASSTAYLDTDQIEAFLELVPAKPRLLDVGCGIGKEMAIFHERGFRVTGLDPSSGLLAIARMNNPDLEFVEGTMTNMPFTNGSFDGLWVHTSILHLESESDVEKAFKEFHRVSCDAGILHVVTQSREEGEPAITTRATDGDRPRVFRSSTVREIRDLLETNGFAVLLLEKYKEGEKFPGGRMDVGRIHALAKKVTL